MAERNKTRMEYKEDEFNFDEMEKSINEEGRRPLLKLRSSSVLRSPLPPPLLPLNWLHTSSGSSHAYGAAANTPTEQNTSTMRMTRNASRQQDVRARNQGTQDPKELFYKIISSQQAFLAMKEVIKRVRVVLVVNPETIRKLLIQFNWDEDRLIESYFEGKKKIFQDTNIPPITPSSGLYDSLDSMMKECKICYENLYPEDMASMLCGHNFCKNCWTSYLTCAINSCLTQDIVCPHPGCRIIMEEQGIRKALEEGSHPMRKYYRLITNSFVECHVKYRWCSSILKNENYCTRAFRIDTPKWDRKDRIVCVCGHISCSDCSNDYHYPIECSLLSTWQKKCNKLSKQNPEWTVNSTNICPFCQGSNRKSYSNLQRCRKCKENYILLWDYPLNYESDGVNSDFARFFSEPGTDDSQRVMRNKFYFLRFIQHEDSLKREKELHIKASNRAEELRTKYNFHHTLAHTIVEAVQILASARTTVMYSYVFVFYAHEMKDIDSVVDCQGCMEESVEKLSYLISRFLSRSPEHITEKWTQSLTTNAECTENTRLALVQLVNKGYRDDTWKLWTE